MFFGGRGGETLEVYLFFLFFQIPEKVGFCFLGGFRVWFFCFLSSNPLPNLQIHHLKDLVQDFPKFDGFGFFGLLFLRGILFVNIIFFEPVSWKLAREP